MITNTNNLLEAGQDNNLLPCANNLSSIISYRLDTQCDLVDSLIYEEPSKELVPAASSELSTTNTPPERIYQNLSETKTLRSYQVEALDFIESTNANCLIADQQGLGKTLEVGVYLREHPEICPALILVPAGNIWQWQHEMKDWVNNLPNGCWVVTSGKKSAFLPPGFSLYVMSMDTLRQFVKPKDDATIGVKQSKKTKGSANRYQQVADIKYEVDWRLQMLGIKTVVADEIHRFKNSTSSRSNALVEMIRLLNIKHKIFMSGTYILNRASEAFIPLNLLDPINFPSLGHFERNYLTNDYNRIKSWMLPTFKEITSQYVIRRERNQVLQDLPKFQRVFQEMHIDSEELKKQYNAQLDELNKRRAEKGSGKLTYNDIKDSLIRMRSIIGRAKAMSIIDTVKEFIEENESEKLVLGVHHHSVSNYLLSELAEFNPLLLDGQDSADRKQKLIEAFQRPDRRIMIVGIIAGGTGLNLQFCNNCIILERQWNAATEEQFEDRFNRFGQTLPVTSAYPVLNSTVDQWFNDRVESTRKMFGETVACDFEQWMTEGQVNDMVDWALNNYL